MDKGGGGGKPLESWRNPFGNSWKRVVTLSFSNKRPISIAIDISAATRYARLMDPLRRALCPFHEPLSPFLSSIHPDGRSAPAASTPLAAISLFLHLYLSLLPLPTCKFRSRFDRSLSLSLSDLIKENTRHTHTIAHIEYHRFRIFDSKS